MSEAVQIALIVSTGPTLVGLLGILHQVIVVQRSDLIRSDMSNRVQEIHIATNSMKDALIKATAIAAHAQGVEAEREAQRLREDEKKKGN